MDRQVDLEKAVEAFGGFAGLARNLGLSVSTVHGWARRDSLPIWRADQIAKAARKRKLDVYKDPRKKRRKKVA
jgi:uncharacterized protein YjcR